ncbi:MAG: hypothetical protein C3F13_02130 [Anaerolineales bacterium]|nr:hypothetical protein [Anaerolineae bacterium]PWB56358.1 MAG: hypothetical protein C3F13_02130 [Anaerolineales bacterium]
MALGRKYFRTEGVVVKHPDIDTTLEVQRIPSFTLDGKPVVPDGFEPFRPVIDLNVVKIASPATKVNRFTPPIEVKVRFTPADLAAAEARGKSLCLGYWDGTAWIRCTPPAVRGFQMIYEPRGKYAGWGIVTFDGWGDPGKAWGT